MIEVFAYKGYIGIQAFDEMGNLSKGVLNHPMEDGQLRVVCDASKSNISQGAFNLLNALIPNCEHDLGDIECYKDSKGKIILGWLGPPMRPFNLDKVKISTRGSEFHLLEPFIEEVEAQAPPDFISFIDKGGMEVEEAFLEGI